MCHSTTEKMAAKPHSTPTGVSSLIVSIVAKTLCHEKFRSQASSDQTILLIYVKK
jgi:hypothetical protein